MVVSEQKKKLKNSSDVAEIMRAILGKESELDQQKEHFWVVGVNVKNVIQYIDLVSLGSLSTSIVHPRETFRLAILKGVSSIFCIHNHPGEDAEPSKEDIAITSRLKQAGDIIGITLLDHIILANGTGQYKSFRDSRLINF